MAREPCFTALRTREQLGYIVSLTHSTYGGGLNGEVGALSINVVSKVADPTFLEQRADAFLTNWQAELATTPPETFAAAQAALVTRLLEPPRRLGTESERWWNEVEEGDLHWRRPEQKAVAVAMLTLDDVKACFEQMVLNPLSRRRVAVRVHGCNHPAGGGATNNHEEVAESEKGAAVEIVPRHMLEAWRESMPLYAAQVGVDMP
jgi:insulysin